ncbi:MAG TPA: hypothetical protein VLE97_08665 [Gaiellaceae bacterium]|nr:hypothetical protein [Gaiellaceae bacterium]
MIDVATDLLGEVVEIYERREYGGDGGYSLRSRGVVRAVYLADKHLHVLVEHSLLGYDSVAYSDRAADGGFQAYSLHEGRARVVQRCCKCASWDQKSRLYQEPVRGEDAWEHKSGEGCKKVGHGG